LFQKDLSYLQQWLEAFVANFEKIIAIHSLEPRRNLENVQADRPPLFAHDLIVLLSTCSKKVTMIS
ncbi:hypothetical protein E2320_001434, partial [Naja naja]